MRKALIIGGTGTISTAVVRALAEDGTWDITLLNRGNRKISFPDGARTISADVHDEKAVREKLGDTCFDVVCDFIGFRREDAERDFRLFQGKTGQFIFISSASAYHKPSVCPFITEGTTLANPYWQYSRDKIACEEYLMARLREDHFPVTIVRPSHTYDERRLPVAVHGDRGSWQVLLRMLRHQPVIIPGDGTSLWTVTFNTDFARGFTGLMGNPQAVGEVFQITGDEVLTWNQIHQIIADELGVPLIPYHVSSDFLAEAGARYDLRGQLLGDKASSVIFDNRKLKRLVPDMRTTVPFYQGAHLAVSYIRSHPECRIEDPDFDAWCDRVVQSLESAKNALI